MSNKFLTAIVLLLSVWIFEQVVARRLMKQWRQRKFWNRLTEKEPLELQILDDDNEYRRLAKKTAVRLLNEMIEILKTGEDKKLIEQTISHYLENDNGIKIEPHALLYWFRRGVRGKLREAGYDVGEAERFATVFSAIEARIDKGENEYKRLARE